MDDRINNFYVYVYLDPRKPGGFDYGEFHFDFEPFYVGKGQGIQWLTHLGLAQSKTKSYKLNKIRKIQSLGLEPKIIKYKENLTEEEAFDLEKKLIKTIGRLDLGHGPLTNLTDGGDGTSGLVGWNKGRTKFNDPSLARAAEKMKATMTGRTAATHSGIARMAEKMRGRTKETHNYLATAGEKISIKLKGRKRGTKFDTPWIAFTAEKISTALKGRTKETYLYLEKRAEKMRVMMTGRTKENHPGVARQAEKMKVIMTGRTKETDSGYAKVSEKLKGRTKNPKRG